MNSFGLKYFINGIFFKRFVYSVCVYGGGDRKAQINNIEKGVEIIIATPGRLNDLVEANVIDVCTITFLILDEGNKNNNTLNNVNIEKKIKF